MDFWDIYLRIASLLLLCTGVLSTIIRDASASCSLKHDDTYRELESCLELGDDYIKKYLKYVQRGKSKNMCRKFEDFGSCMDTLLERCPDLRESIPVQWTNVYDVIKCSCQGNEDCSSTISCFEYEYGSLLMERCDDHYRFNRRQRTRHRCHHLHENIRCKESLVTSSCGNETGDFAFHIFKLHERHSIAEYGCARVSREEKYAGFMYSDGCPSNFTAEMEQCGASLADGERLQFFEDNDLISKRKKDIPQACRKYQEYEECLTPLKERCSEGSEVVYDYLGPLRTYIMKMRFICHAEHDSYRHHLTCYKRVLDNATLAMCSTHWTQLEPRLQSVTAYQFYCQIGSPETQQIRSSLGELVGCYEEVFANECGSQGGQTIGALMSEAFMDPYYLQYDYKPDCAYHNLPDTLHIQNDGGDNHRPRDHVTSQRPDRPRNPSSTKHPGNKGGSQTDDRASKPEPVSGNSSTAPQSWDCLLTILSLTWILLRLG